FSNGPIVFAFTVGRIDRIARAPHCLRCRCLPRRRRSAWRSMIGERLIEIFAEAHALTSSSFACRLSYFRVDALYAPTLRAAHLALAALEHASRHAHAQPRTNSKDSRIAHDFAVSIKRKPVLMAGKVVNGGETMSDAPRSFGPEIQGAIYARGL